MSVRDDNIDGDSTSFEVDRHTDDQPPRGDLIEPDDIDADAATGDLDAGANLVDDPDPFHRDDEPPRAATSTDDLPESQGFDTVDADRLTEDAAARPAFDDEEWDGPTV